MKCIDCIWAIQMDPAVQCKKPNPEIKQCDSFKRAYRSIEKQVQEMLEG